MVKPVIPELYKAVVQTAWALAIGTTGFAIAKVLGFPAPALLGPSLFVTLVCLMGARLELPVLLRNCAFIAIGITMGSGVTPEIVVAARQWPISFVALGLSILAVFFACYTVLRRLWGFDHDTAALASTPGHLSYIISLSITSRGDVPTISVIQSIRVLALTALVPLAITAAGYDMAPSVHDAVIMPPMHLVAVVIASVVAGFFLEKLGVPAAYLIGGMLASAATHMTGVFEGQLPTTINTAAFVIMGTLIGSRFTNTTFATLRKALLAGLAVTFVAMAVTTAFALLAAQIVSIPLAQLLIAFAPGGVESMAAMAIILHADPAFVAIHHLWRLVILTFLAPMIISAGKKAL